MYCIARTHIYRSIPPDIKQVLNLRNGVRFDGSTLGLEQGDTDFGAHIRGLQVLLWPSRHLGNVRTFWIYFEVGLCLHSAGQLLIRHHEMHILRQMCYDLTIDITATDSTINLPEGQPLEVSVVTAVSPLTPQQALLFSFLSALWMLYAGRVSPVGHCAILRFKQRHFLSLERVCETFREEWSPRVPRSSAIYEHFINAAYSPAATDDNWDTQLWRHAAAYNPWATRGRFDEHEAARVIDIVSPAGRKIVVRLFKTTYTRRGGPYTGMLRSTFTEAIAGMPLRADVTEAVDFDDLSQALSMLDMGDGLASSPPWLVDWVSLGENAHPAEPFIKVNLAWARHKGDSPTSGGDGAATTVSATAMMAREVVVGNAGDKMVGGDARGAAVTAEHMLDLPAWREETTRGSGTSSDWMQAPMHRVYAVRVENEHRQRLHAVREEKALFDWLSTTTMKLVNTRYMMRELGALLATYLGDHIPGRDVLQYWASARDEADLEPKLALACTGVCRTAVPHMTYVRRPLSSHGQATVRAWRRALLRCCVDVLGVEGGDGRGVDESTHDEVIRGVFPTYTTVFSVTVVTVSLGYLVTAIAVRGVSFEEAAQACVAILAFFLTPYLTVLHPRLYGMWSVVGSLSGVMTGGDCIDREIFKCLAGQKAELREMGLLQKRGALLSYYSVHEGSFIGSGRGTAELQFTYSVNDVRRLVRFGYNLRGTLCVKTTGLHDVWKTTTFDEGEGFRVIVENETTGFVKECLVQGNAGAHRIR